MEQEFLETDPKSDEAAAWLHELGAKPEGASTEPSSVMTIPDGYDWDQNQITFDADEHNIWNDGNYALEFLIGDSYPAFNPPVRTRSGQLFIHLIGFFLLLCGTGLLVYSAYDTARVYKGIRTPSTPVQGSGLSESKETAQSKGSPQLKESSSRISRPRGGGAARTRRESLSDNDFSDAGGDSLVMAGGRRMRKRGF